ncbi:30S ribosome-binding factor RbfA [Patescibacteria group bacterium]
MKNRRILKVNALIKQEVGKILQDEIDDPRFGFVTIIKVDTSPDLEHAKIFLSYIGSKNKEKEIRDVIKKNQLEVQRRLNHTLEMKNIPLLAFEFDYSIRHADRIERLIKKAKDE